ncbi:hypothetical protein NW762_011934 [Fusarium torreyae]|uniref:Uncharacterized protein n=1 Tax=Fusarium torreyae TaxID=1237075 RepID=A0A9W8V960_9HYPO|nr:hypothetical protein NW762_011934 [Fusarium torreyae]
MVGLNFLVGLLALSAEALASPAKPAVCSTILGTKTVKNVPTSTTTAVKKITITKKFIRKLNVVVVPVAKTSTIRTTETDTVTFTADQETDTAWDTITSESTIVSSRTAWTTITTTSTTTTTKDVTSTVQRAAGFTPIHGPGWVPRKREQLEKKAVKAKAAPPGGNLPQSVRCVVDKPIYSTKTVSTRIQGPRRTLKAATRTKMTTISTTTTETEYPSNAKTTLTTVIYPTTTSFVDVTSTSTISETVTVESQVPVATIYDMCSSDNILTSANGGGLIASWDDLTGDYSEVKFGDYYTSTNPAYAANYVFSNGPCGYWKNGGAYAA